MPALKHSDIVITDSHAILIYLVEEFGGQSTLYPSDKLTRIKILDLLFFNGTNFFRRDSDLMTEIIAKSVQNMTRHSIKILECYESLETFLFAASFVAGNDVSYYTHMKKNLSNISPNRSVTDVDCRYFNCCNAQHGKFGAAGR